jgi:hypothetical protein
VVVEYFSKWIEAKPLVNIAAVGLRRFFRWNIICHFVVPRKITVDNANNSIAIYSRISTIRWASNQLSHQYIIYSLMEQWKR